MRKGRWLLKVAVGLFTIVGYHSAINSSYAKDRNCPPARIRTAVEVCENHNNLNAMNFGRCKCKPTREFYTRDVICVDGMRFRPFDEVDIYAVKNRRWRNGDIIRPSQVIAEQMALTDRWGRLNCVCLPTDTILPVGLYDIVVDVNQDGTFNDCDVAYRRDRKAGFKVE